MQHPAGHDLSLPLPLFERIHGEAVIAFGENRTLGIRKVIVFEATYPRPTRSRAYASPISLPKPSQGARTGRRGVTNSALSIADWVPSPAMDHVSLSPRFHPGRSDFPSPVGDLGYCLRSSLPCDAEA